MLKKINEGGVQGDNFVIQIMGPEILTYTFGNVNLELNLCYEPTKRKIYVYAEEIQTLDVNTKQKMIDDIKKAVVLLTGDFVVI